jgi:hypothetical protein
MGEYAKLGNQTIKIGTCEDMYYLRYDDRYRLVHISGNINPCSFTDIIGCRFRIPFPDEDTNGPGGYEDYSRSLPLYKNPKDERSVATPFPAETLQEQPGIVQLSHKCGYLIDVTCHHGARLPEMDGEATITWNGRDPFMIHLSSIKAVGREDLRPVVRCKFCGSAWLCEWGEIEPYLDGADERLKKRLVKYKNES